MKITSIGDNIESHPGWIVVSRLCPLGDLSPEVMYVSYLKTPLVLKNNIYLEPRYSSTTIMIAESWGILPWLGTKKQGVSISRGKHGIAGSLQLYPAAGNWPSSTVVDSHNVHLYQLTLEVTEKNLSDGNKYYLAETLDEIIDELPVSVVIKMSDTLTKAANYLRERKIAEEEERAARFGRWKLLSKNLTGLIT